MESAFAVPRWHGFRVVAGDASKLQLFLRDTTRRQVREAIAFALYLPGIEMSLAFQLYSPSVGERQMLFEHLHYLNEDDLLVLDRGYPGNWLCAVLTQTGQHFCMRVDDTGYTCVKTFKRSGRSEQIVTLRAPNRPDCDDFGCRRELTTVRLIRVITPNARQYVLMTSLLDSSAFPAQDFADLYHSRWRIEEAFKRIKHRLNLEQLSGISWLAAQQDFGAKMLCDNLNALAVFCATEQNLDVQTRQYYRINRAYVFAHLKRCLPRWLIRHAPSINELLRVFAELARNLLRFIKGASKPRPGGPKPHKALAFKSIG